MELIDYGARWYDPRIGRFISPDTIIPDPKNPQSLNRYSYVINNPLRFTDSTGHCFEPASATICVAILALTVEVVGVGIVVAAEYTGALDPVAESIANGIRDGGRATADAVQDTIIEGSTETYPLEAPPDPYSTSRPTLGGEFAGPLHLPGGSTADLPDLGTGIDFPLIPNTNELPDMSILQARVIQSGGHTIRSGTARALNKYYEMNLHAREWGRALENLKDAWGLDPDHHGKIEEDGTYTDPEGNVIDNLLNYLP